MRVVLALMLAFAQQRGTPPLPQPDPSVRGTIQGIVKSTSGDGIPDVQITLTGSVAPARGGPAPLNSTTDSSGRFSFPDLSAGVYRIQAQRDGYFPPPRDGLAFPNLTGLTAASVSASISKDAPNAQVTISLVPGGVVSGQLRDAQGKPAAGVSVVILQSGYQDGRRRLTPVRLTTGFNPAGGVTTNDRGEYRLFWVPPGEYYVRTDTSSGLRRIPSSSSTVAQTTFYPGTVDSSRAVPVVVGPGQEVSAIDFTVEYAQAFTISGKVTISAPGGRVRPDGSIFRSVDSFYVVPQNADPGDTIPLTSNARPTGAPNQLETDFELQGIPPGSYYVYPVFGSGPRGGGGSGNGSYSTRIPVEVIDRNVTDLRGDIHAKPDLTIHLTMKGTPSTGPLPSTPRGVQLRPQEALGVLLNAAGTLNAIAQPDGTIVIPNLFPARYKILVPAAGYYLADIRRGPKSLYNDAILDATEQDSAPVEITFSTGGGEVRGIVRNRKGEPTTARVALVPQPSRRGNTNLYRRAVTVPASGEFTVGNIAPGEYKLFAFEALPTNADESAEFLAKYETRGHAVTVDAGAKLSDVALDLISQ